MSGSYPLPSFANGFARNASESLHPALWNGLVGFWEPSIGIQGQKLYDHSGYRRDGTMTGMSSTSWVIGRKGRALSCSGAGTDYVSIPPLTLTNFSVMMWVRVEDVSNFPTALANNVAGIGAVLLLRINDATDGYYEFDDNSGQFVDNTFAHGIALNTWFHFAFVRNGTTGTVYINGVQKNTKSNGSMTGGATFSNSFFYGRDNRATPSPVQPWNGKLGSLAIYNRALFQPEILQAMTLSPLQTKDFIFGKAPSAGASIAPHVMYYSRTRRAA